MAKGEALSKTTPINTKVGRYRPDDQPAGFSEGSLTFPGTMQNSIDRVGYSLEARRRIMRHTSTWDKGRSFKVACP
jgi:hypothetical protein